MQWAAVTALASGFVALLVAAETLHRPTCGIATSPPPHIDRVLTTDNRGILNMLFKRLLGNPKCERLTHTGSEV
jgi:hypothetical protein